MEYTLVRRLLPICDQQYQGISLYFTYMYIHVYVHGSINMHMNTACYVHVHVRKITRVDCTQVPGQQQLPTNNYMGKVGTFPLNTQTTQLILL